MADKLTDSERAELERYRVRKKKESKYKNSYATDHYKRLICLLPVEHAEYFEQAKGDNTASTYILSLIYKDMRSRGILT